MAPADLPLASPALPSGSSAAYAPAELSAYPQPRPDSASRPPLYRTRRSGSILRLSLGAAAAAAEPSSPAHSAHSLPTLPGDPGSPGVPSPTSSASASAPPSPDRYEVRRGPIRQYAASDDDDDDGDERTRILSGGTGVDWGSSGRCPTDDAASDEATSLPRPDAASAKWHEGPLAVAAVKLAVLFLVFTAVVVGTFWLGLPEVDDEDRAVLKLPRSFADLQALNSLFQKYKDLYPQRVLVCGVVSYLFVQAFSLPGSMYISILFGAAYGIIYGLLLSCLSIGSLFCYTLSSLLAPPLLTLPAYRARLEAWRVKILGPPDKPVSLDGIFAFLVVLRIAPFPPHWVTNVVAPHLGIGAPLLWASCFIGVAPVSVIHVTVGAGLDSVTSADDLHILSVRNVLALVAVAVAVLIPVGLKRVFRKDLGELGEADVERALGELDAEAVGGDDSAAHRADDSDTLVDFGPYQAVDSGVVLAGPSAGDPGLLDDPRPRATTKPGTRRPLSTIIEDVHPALAEPSAGAGLRVQRQAVGDKARGTAAAQLAVPHWPSTTTASTGNVLS